MSWGGDLLTIYDLDPYAGPDEEPETPQEPDSAIGDGSRVGEGTPTPFDAKFGEESGEECPL